MERRKFIGVPLAMTAAAAASALASGSSAAQQTALVDARDVSYSPQDGAASPRSVQGRLRDALTVRDFGAIGDGVADDSAAFALADAAQGQIYVPEGDYRVAAQPALGKFYGPGRVTLGTARAYVHPHAGPIHRIHAEVFGLEPTDRTDSSSALQAAVDFANDRAIPLELPPNRKIRVSRTITIKIGAEQKPEQPARRFMLYGNSSQIMADVAGPAFHLDAQCPPYPQGANQSGFEVGFFLIDNLRFNGFFAQDAGLPGRCAIQIGTRGRLFSGYQKCLLRDVFVEGFQNVATIKLVGLATRLICFDRVVSNAGGLSIVADEPGAFIGDLDFINCQFGGSKNNPPLRIESAASGKASEIRGIRFTNQLIYGPGTLLYAHNNGGIGDIWFDSTQWESVTEEEGAHGLWISLDNTARVFQVFVNSPYIVGYRGHGILLERFGNASVQAVVVRGGNLNFIQGPQYRPIALTQFDNTSILDCEFFGDIKAESCISVYSAKNVIVSRCRAAATEPRPFFVEIGGNSDRVIVANNIARTLNGLIANAASGTVVNENNISY